MIKEFIERIRFANKSDRLGPDLFWTHWKLHFMTSGKKLCKQKFGEFKEGAEFRPGAYAFACSKICLGKGVVY